MKKFLIDENLVKAIVKYIWNSIPSKMPISDVNVVLSELQKLKECVEESEESKESE